MEDYGLFEKLFTQISVSIMSEEFGGATAQTQTNNGKSDASKAANNYKLKLQKQYGVIQILGQPEPQKLGKVYTDVYLHEKPTHGYAMAIEELEHRFRDRGRFGRDERIDGLEFAKKQRRLFVLGKPGAGKTTFMKFLTIQSINGDLPKIPIFVSLNDLANKNQTLLKYIISQFDVCNFSNPEAFIHSLLINGIGLILFDGLDEVQKEKNRRVLITEDIKEFINKYSRNQFIITCRIAASDYNFTGFKYVEMADFTYDQVEKFVKSWFAGEEVKLRGFLTELAATENQRMMEMTTSPLLLALLCIQFDASMAFPPYRSEIYDKALTVLLEAWDAHRSISRDDLVIEHEDRYRALTTKRKMQLMSRLAYHSFIKGDLFIRQRWLEDKISIYLEKMPNLPRKELINAKLILKGMESQHGLLVERATSIFSFSHLILQEYFTARYIANYSSFQTLSVLMSEEKIVDTRWREVFLFVAELLPEGDDFILWMAQTLQEMANRGKTKEIVGWVQKQSSMRPFAKNQVASKAGYLACAILNAEPLSFAGDRIATKNHARKRMEISNLAQVKASKFYRILAELGSLFTARANDIKRARIRDHSLAKELEDDRHFYYLEMMQLLIKESKQLNWPALTNALTKVPKPSKHSSEEEWKFVLRSIRRIEHDIILVNWVWKSPDANDYDNLNEWLKGHDLLFKCLDRIVLEDLDREEFEDEMLYTLPKNNQQAGLQNKR